MMESPEGEANATGLRCFILDEAVVGNKSGARAMSRQTAAGRRVALAAPRWGDPDQAAAPPFHFFLTSSGRPV
jgi:hypothetical protein